MPVDLVDELRREIAAGRVACIVGAGVSIAATFDPTRKPNVASWLGLLEEGVARCTGLYSSLPAQWAPTMRGLIALGADGHTESLLSVARQITHQLGGSTGGEFKRWMRETVGSLRLLHPDVPRALGNLGVPLLTTNYDDVLEEATGLPALTWREASETERVLRGEDRAILHLHGYWRRPESVVLDVRSYEEILRDPHAQAVLRALRLTKTLVFVGFGGGLDDPNFGTLLRWTREVFAGSEVRHFRLARADEQERLSQQHPQAERIFTLSYGSKHEDLAPYLRALAPAKSDHVPTIQPVAAGALPRPRVLVAGPYFGIPLEQRKEIEQRLREEPPEQAREMLRITLRNSSLRRAQLAAILRHDVIVDLSPWRAFASRSSLGLRDVERDQAPAEGTSPPQLYLGFREDDFSWGGDAGPAGLLARLRALREGQGGLCARIDELAAAGLTFVGFDRVTASWCQPLLDTWPEAPVLIDADLGVSFDVARVVRAPEPLDGPVRAPSLDDYLRALRVVAGQVTLAGETEPRPIRDVFVEMEIQRDTEIRKTSTAAPAERARGENTPDEPDDEDPPTRGGLREENSARRKAEWGVPGGRTIVASAIGDVGRRVLLWGPAGTGKSTLLRWIACSKADEGRLPIWVTGLSELGDDLPDTLARRALLNVELPDGPSSAREQLREAIESGRALLYLDGFDEAPPVVHASLPARLAKLHPELRVLVASRPLGRAHTGMLEITLSGLPVTGAEEMLRGYFGEQPWISDLIRELGNLPDGATWSRTPVLLGLAAALYRVNHCLPDATLDLYQMVVDHMLSRLPPAWRGPAMERELCRLAQKMLLPRSGVTTVDVRAGDLPHAHRDAFLLSGLFTGDEWLRFTHLTLGEFLAAKSDFNLAEERRHARQRAESVEVEADALEVLPMAHAFAGEAALEEVLNEAQAKFDTPGHRMLRLLLRSVGYGGKHVDAFGTQHAVAILALLADRIQRPSGRFGDAERRLLDDAERALLVLRPLLKPEAQRAIEDKLAPLLCAWGDVSAEAYTMLWILGTRYPDQERRWSRWWPTIRRQARAIVRAGLSVDEIVAITSEERFASDYEAVEILKQFTAYLPRLRRYLHEAPHVFRSRIVNALAEDPGSTTYIRECLNNDDGHTCVAALRALAAAPTLRAANLDRLLAYLDDGDKHSKLQLIASSLLLSEPTARARVDEIIRKDPVGLLRWLPKEVFDPALGWRAGGNTKRDNDGPVPLPILADFSEWLALLRENLQSESPSDIVVVALAEDVDSRARIRELAYRGDATDVCQAAVRALASDAESRTALLAFLDSTNIPLRVAAVQSLGRDASNWIHIRHLLRDASGEVRAASIKVLAEDSASAEGIRLCLSESELNHNVLRNSVKALAKNPPSERDRLWAYFDSIRNRVHDTNVWWETIRATVVQGLGNDDGSRARIVDAYKNDISRTVRVAAARVLKDDSTVRDRLLSSLKGNDWPVRLIAFRLLVPVLAPRQRIRELFLVGPPSIRASTVQPLASDPGSRDMLRDYLKCSDDDYIDDVFSSVVGALSKDPESKKILRTMVQDTTSLSALESKWFSVGPVLKVLADDPEAHPLLLDRVCECVASDKYESTSFLVPALASYPAAWPYLRSLMRVQEAPSDVVAGAVRALAADVESRQTIRTMLDSKHSEVLLAAIEVLADDLEVRPCLRKLLSNGDKKVRLAVVKALSPDREEQSFLRGLLDDERDEELRLTIVRAIAKDPVFAPQLRAQLKDRSSDVRKVAARALSPNPTCPGNALTHIPALRIALRLAGSDPTPAVPLPSLSLQDRLDAFVKSPRPLHLRQGRDTAFAETLLGWLIVRLAWASSDGALSNGRTFGETQKEVTGLLAVEEPFVIRVAMDSSELPRERHLHPTHNLIEAWRVAKHLSADNALSIFLACADVDFEHLTPPTLEPGKVCWGPGFFGFRLRQSVPVPLDEIQLLTSTEAAALWRDAPENQRNTLQERLAGLALDPDLDPWTLVPMLSRVGDQLPPATRAALLERMPRAASEAAQQLEYATSKLRAKPAFPALQSPAEPETTPDASTKTPRVQLQALLQPIRTALSGTGDIGPAISHLEDAVKIAAAPEIGPEDRDELVLLLDGLRDRTGQPQQAKLLLSIAALLDGLELSRDGKQRLGDVRHWLNRY